MPIYWAFLTFMLFVPSSENTEYSFIFPGMDKIVHFIIFFLLGFLFKGAFPKLKFFYYISILLVYAIFTEIIQDVMNMGRSGEILDLVADLFGLFVAYYTYNRSKPLLLKAFKYIKL